MVRLHLGPPFQTRNGKPGTRNQHHGVAVALGSALHVPGSEFEGAVAQLGERLVCNQEVVGSNPIGSTRKGIFDFRISIFDLADDSSSQTPRESLPL